MQWLCYVGPLASQQNVVQKMLRLVIYCYQPYNIWMCSQHAGQTCYCFYTYANLSGFLIIHPDLVLMISAVMWESCSFIYWLDYLFFLVFVHCMSLSCYAPHLVPLPFDCDLAAVHIACFNYCCCLYAHWHVLLGFYWYCLICLPVGLFLGNAVLWLCIVGMCLLWLMWVLCIVCCVWCIFHLM